MTDWLALAKAMHPDIPAEQAEKLAPILAALEQRFQPLAAVLPIEAESATVFLAEGPRS